MRTMPRSTLFCPLSTLHCLLICVLHAHYQFVCLVWTASEFSIEYCRLEILAPPPRVPVCILLAGSLCKELTSSDHKSPYSHNYLQIQNFPDECQLEVGRPSQRRHNLIVCSKQAGQYKLTKNQKTLQIFSNSGSQSSTNIFYFLNRFHSVLSHLSDGFPSAESRGNK